MNHISPFILIVTFLPGICQLQAQMKADLKVEIDKIIYYDTELLSKNIPGFSVGLIYQDSVFTFHYGSTDPEVSETKDDQAIFELGGLSKVFTAALVEQLVLDGLLDYDTPFNHFLDSAYVNQSLEHISIGDLISHQSGLPKLPFEFGIREKDFGNPYAHYSKTDLLDFYKNYIPDEDAKQDYFYSKVNYALLEIAVEQVTKNDFERILAEKIFAPLGMHQSFVHNNAAAGKSPVAGYNVAGKAVEPFSFQSFAASEGIKSNLSDLLIFLKANLDNTSALGSLFENIQQPIAETRLNKNAKVAKGWHVVSFKKYYNAILHSGSTNGHRAFIGFVKETGTGVIVLSNSETGIDGLGFLILRMLNHNWKKKRK